MTKQIYRKPNRRDFLKGAAAAGLGVWVAGRTTMAEELAKNSPSERINVACIGVGGKGDGDSSQVAELANVIAICDVDSDHLQKKAKELEEHYGKKVPTFSDFRQMLDKLGKEIDAVTISTPDHTHAIATMSAIQLGKHVYTQKPMTHDVWEARQLRLAARSHKIQSQMGNQGTASPIFREGVEAMQAGLLGNITQVHVWTNRPIWAQSPEITSRPAPATPPATLAWDLWLGTAPERPFSAAKSKTGKAFYHPWGWRGFRDFGTGALGDMGCHTVNQPFMALKLEYPTSIQAESEELNAETYPAWARVKYQFPARGGLPPVEMIWYEGKKDGVLVHPPADLVAKCVAGYQAIQKEKGTPAGATNKNGKQKNAKIAESGLNLSGSIIVGDKGMLYSPHDYGGEWYLLPHDKYASYKAPPQTLPRNGAAADTGPMSEKGNDPFQKAEWLAAIKGHGKPLSNFDYAGLLTETIQLGNLAIRAGGKKLEWDGPNMKFTNAPEAEQWLKREYRKPWTM